MIDFIFGLFLILFILGLEFILSYSSASVGGASLCFMGIFFLLGIYLCFRGLRKIIQDRKTVLLGKECYGYIIKIYPNGYRTTVGKNTKEYLDADILIYTGDKNVLRLTETIGSDWDKFFPDDFIKVKLYQKDINIIERIDKSQIPPESIAILEDAFSKLTSYEKYGDTVPLEDSQPTLREVLTTALNSFKKEF